MTGKTFQFDFSDLKLTVDQIERVMGYPEGESQETVYDIVSRRAERGRSNMYLESGIQDL